MSKIHCFLLFIFLSLFYRGNSFAQLGLSHEVGLLVGPASFYTDYGERWSIPNNLINTGLGVGLVHYMNFAYRADCNCYARQTYFNDHFKVRNELDYFRTSLEHEGPVSRKDNANGALLRGMHGNSQTLEIGTHLEYYIRSIRDFTAFAYAFSPFISVGVHYVSYHPDSYSDFGSIMDPKNQFPTFQGGINLDSGSAWAVVAIAGTRYRLGRSSDLAFEARWQYYDTDWLDGLNHDVPQNKFNDWIFWLNVGYIYYINF